MEKALQNLNNMMNKTIREIIKATHTDRVSNKVIKISAIIEPTILAIRQYDLNEKIPYSVNERVKNRIWE